MREVLQVIPPRDVYTYSLFSSESYFLHNIFFV